MIETVLQLETHNKRVEPVPASHKSTVVRGRTLTRMATTKPPEAPKKKEGTTTAAATRMNRGSYCSSTLNSTLG